MTLSYKPKPIGLILQEADLITPAQIEVALQDQQYVELPLGEILALHGWIRQQTADFFVEEWPRLTVGPLDCPLGHYLRQAALLEEHQIQEILREQKRLGVRFGSVAVIKGWLRPKTLDYFLENLIPQSATDSAFQVRRVEEIPTPSPREAPRRKTESGLIFSESTITVPKGFALVGVNVNNNVNNIDHENYDLAGDLEGHIDIDDFFWTE
ncbi:MAG: hypothetical protein ACK5CA_02010 [Cyanobacteriota bacterium]|jgi:hypothetical protein